LGPDADKILDHRLSKKKNEGENIGIKKSKGLQKQNRRNIDIDKLTSSKSCDEELLN
jgi:hypothetical protein